MAQASPPLTVTPKEMGRHLRDVRRKKGLSLSEVARGAGLSRRELVAYERGKAPIPESDLWVLAGSCGVDISALVPTTPVPELEAGPTSMGETVALLRRGQDDAGLGPYLASLNRLRELPPGKRVPIKGRELEAMADALGREPATIENRLQEVMHVSPEEAARLRELILPPVRSRRRPRAIAAPDPTPVAESETVAPGSAPADAEAAAAETISFEMPQPSEPWLTPEPDVAGMPSMRTWAGEPDPEPHAAVDVFEELARLPEPLPLPDPGAPLPDLLAPPQPLEHAVELVDAATMASDATYAAAGTSDSGLIDGPASVWSAADAPPIDVALRQGSDTWNLAAPPLTPDFTRLPSDPSVTPPTGSEPPLWTREPSGTNVWEPPPWQPPAPEGGSSEAPPAFWEGTDDWVPAGHDDIADAPAEPADIDGVPHGDVWIPAPLPTDSWTANAWPADLAGDEPSSAFAASVDSVIESTTESVDAADSIIESPVELVDSTLDSTDSTALPVRETPAWEPHDGYSPEPTTTAPIDMGPWDHEPDPEAVSTGFYVDWGTAGGEDDAPAAWHSLLGTDATTQLHDDFGATGYDGYLPRPTETEAVPSEDPVEDSAAGDGPSPGTTASDDPAVPIPFTSQWATNATHANANDDTDTTDETTTVEGTTSDPTAYEPTVYEPIAFEPTAYEPTVYEPAAFEPTAFEATFTETGVAEVVIPEVLVDEPVAEPTSVAPEILVEPDEVEDELPRIMWRAEMPALEAGTPSEATEPAPEADTDTPDGEQFVVAGQDWQLGNALPLVEVRGQGALVMRRADERWALADVVAADDFAVEVDVDFRSGPGLGVLFRADVDDEGRMSGYSFDIDPIYDGGGYLVRQWQADRELWNPIARIGAGDATSMYGQLTIRLELHDDRLVALVNGAEVLTVESLKQASADRGREAAAGHRVGIQAWSSSDLVIETLRVAAR